MGGLQSHREAIAALKAAGYVVVPADCVPAALSSKIVRLDEPPRVMCMDVIEAAAACTGRTVSELLGRSRLGPLVESRHMAMYVSSRAFGHRPATIGRAFRRDPTTVQHAVEQVARKLSERGVREHFSKIAQRAAAVARARRARLAG